MYTLHETSKYFLFRATPAAYGSTPKGTPNAFCFVFLKTTEIKSNYILRRLLGSNTYFHMHLLWRVYFEFLPF